MAKKKKSGNWLSPTKQRELEARQQKERQQRLIKYIAVSLCALVLISALVTLIVMVSRPYYATIEVENYGTIVVKLNKSEAPITVKNFVSLAEDGFYDGLTFHRIIEGFMMQGGCPKGNGTGGNVDENGKEINIKGEFSKNGVNNTISHSRGVISMARSGGKPEADYYNTASSQFFIVHKDSTHLDGNYAAFGYVVSGMEVVDKICTEAKPTDNNGTIPKAAQPVIKSITISRSN